MARIFENPANNHQESVDGASAVATFFLGLFYLAYQGLWPHVLVWLLVVILPAILLDPAILVFTLPCTSIGYAIGIQELLSNRYLRMGWREVDLKPGQSSAIVPHASQPPSDVPRTVGAPDTIYRPGGIGIEPPTPYAATHRNCPYCAEEIKSEAIRCKHCHADLTANPV